MSGMKRAAGGSVKKSTRVRSVLVAVSVPLMFLVSLVAWGFSSPVGSSPDDDYHMASIWCAGGIDELCQAADSETSRIVPDVLLNSSGCYAFRPDASAGCKVSPIEDMSTSDRGNFDGSYPPVFYATMNVFAGYDIESSVLFMRTFNALLFVGLISALFFCLPMNRRGPLLWGSLTTAVPLGMFIVPSVNPSSWAVLSAATLWVSLVGYFTSVRRSDRIVLGAIAVLVTIMGAGARSDSAVYSGVAVVVAIILTFERTARYLKLAILPAVLVVLAVAFFLGSGQSSIVAPGGADSKSAPGGKLGLALANIVELPGLWTGSIGTTGLGWLDTAMPAVVWVSTLAVFFAVAFWGIHKLPARKGIAIGIIFASLIVIPMYILVNDNAMVGTGVQPRYIYPLMIILAGLALFGLNRDDLKLSGPQLAVIPIVLTVANSVALHKNIRRYVTGIDVSGPNLDTGIEWWWAIPLSPMTVWAVGSLTFALAMIGVYRYARSAALCTVAATPTAIGI
jgi:hypothetical protein